MLHSYGLDSNPTSEDDENSDIELMDVSLHFCHRIPYRKLIASRFADVCRTTQVQEIT